MKKALIKFSNDVMYGYPQNNLEINNKTKPPGSIKLKSPAIHK